MRQLTVLEHAAFGRFAPQADLRKVRIFDGGEHGWQALLHGAVLSLSRGRAVALGNWVFLPACGSRDLALLAHEVVHCAQFQRWGWWRYFSRGIGEQVRYELFRKVGWGQNPYEYELVPGKPRDRYGMEQQAQIVEDEVRRARWGRLE